MTPRIGTAANEQAVGGSGSKQTGRIVAGVVVPVGLLAVVYALWWISDQALYIGPLDRAAFGWSVVIPLWIATPFVTAIVGRPLSPRATAWTALLLGSTVSGVAAILFWRAVAQPACDYGATRQPIEWVPASLLVGVVIGGGLAISGLASVSLVRRGQPWRALALGAATELAMVFAAVGATAFVVVGRTCQLPH